jgi:hypothetical protein
MSKDVVIRKTTLIVVVIAATVIIAALIIGLAIASNPSNESTKTPNNNSGQVCAQVMTEARNIATGEVKTYPTSCLPNGWEKL